MRWHRDDDVLDLLLRVVLPDPLAVLQDHGQQLLHGVDGFGVVLEHHGAALGVGLDLIPGKGISQSISVDTNKRLQSASMAITLKPPNSPRKPLQILFDHGVVWRLPQ